MAHEIEIVLEEDPLSSVGERYEENLRSQERADLSLKPLAAVNH